MAKTNAVRALCRVVVVLVGASSLFVALMAFAHTKPGRPLLTVMFGDKPSGHPKAKATGAGCPLGFGGPTGTPEEREAVRVRAAERLRGDRAAAARPALGFELDKTTRTQVETWAAEHAIECRKPKHSSADVECLRVPASALPDAPSSLEAKSLWFWFNPNEQLVNVEALRYTNDVELGSASYAGVLTSLTKSAGPPTNTFGEPTAEYLGKGVLAQARADFAFVDYRAEAMATQINYGRFMIQEKYRSLKLAANRVASSRPGRGGGFALSMPPTAPHDAPQL
jgi:hypothetical protein